MEFPDEYGPPNELKQCIDKFNRKIQKRIASNGSQGGGCGCNIKQKKNTTDNYNLNNFTIVTM